MIPVTDSNLRPDALIDQVLCHYALAGITRCRLHARGLNDTFKVETQAGRVLFLRVYRVGWRIVGEIESEVAMLRHLASLAVPVSVPLPRSDGRFLTAIECPEGLRWACLFSAAPGAEVEPKTLTAEQAQAYGEGAAAIHTAADSYQGPQDRPALDLAQLLEGPLGLVSNALAHRAADKSYLVNVASRLRDGIHRAQGLTRGFCHGDLHGRNACLENGVFTFYDFDCCGWGYRAYDLAVFPWAFAVRESEPERIKAMARAFLEGYASRRPPAAADLAAIPAFVAIRQIWLMGLHLGLGDRFGWGWLNDPYFDRNLSVLRRWDEACLTRPDAAWLESA